MEVVFKVESALRKSLAPVKMNIASLGNLTPHLHWHVIPRYVEDPTFPKPIWAVDPAAPPRRDTLAINGGNRVIAADNGAWQHVVRQALESA
jgi:diadenosine tetraphosphate (Ap4A) HIT family hydrolase